MVLCGTLAIEQEATDLNVLQGGSAAITFNELQSQRQSSISSSVMLHSKGRGIAIVNTSSVLVSDNLVTLSSGHSFSVEGEEAIGNQFEGNLAMGPRVSSLGAASDLQPAGFYASNWNNSFRCGESIEGKGICFCAMDSAEPGNVRKWKQ